MRVLRAIALSILAAVGCNLPKDVTTHPQPVPPESTFAVLPPFTPTVVPPESHGEKDKTLAYWKKLKEIMERQPKADQYPEFVKESRRTVDDIRSLPAVGVDPELLEHAEALARYLDRFLSMVEFTKDNATVARRQPGFEKAIVESGQRAIDVSSQVRGLRGKLSYRYSVEFPAVRGA
jgi:hypothetical protein